VAARMRVYRGVHLTHRKAKLEGSGGDV
jgi:hypothetical protein